MIGLKLVEFHGNTVTVRDVGTGYVATIFEGPALNVFRASGGTGTPTFASTDWDRLREMIVRFIENGQD